MKPKQQIVAIAKACRWNETTDSGYTESVFTRGEEEVFAQDLPKYLRDLNAMHEAESILTDEGLVDYGEWLTAVVNEIHRPMTGWWDLNSREVARVSCATAAQRAEAFLRTLNLWVD